MIVIGAALHFFGGDYGDYLGLQVLVIGVIFFIALLFERRTRKRIDATGPEWTATGERFIDPVTGKLTEVHFNPKTGERAYIIVENPSP